MGRSQQSRSLDDAPHRWRFVRFLWTLTLVGLSGCVDIEDHASECRDGAGEFFALVEHNKDFFGSPEDLAMDRWQGLTHSGVLFSFVATPSEGSGRVRGAPQAYTNVTAEAARDFLLRMGVHRRDVDHNVSEAFRDQVAPSTFEGLCAVVQEEWEVPEDTSGMGTGCADGGTISYEFHVRRGSIEKTGGCLPHQTMAEYESQTRVDDAYRDLVAESRTKLGLT